MNKYKEQEVEFDIKNISMGNNTDKYSSLLIKEIKYYPRFYNAGQQVDDFTEVNLSKAKYAVVHELAQMILDNCKYMEIHESNNKKYYEISVSVLHEKEKIDFINKVEKLEQDVRNLKYSENVLISLCEQYKTESLWQMLKRYFQRTFTTS